MWNVQPAPETSEQTQRQSQLAKPAPVTDDKRTVAWIGKSVVFKGELTSAEDMRIEGRVDGTINVRNHDLIVGPHAVIRAEIVAKTIMVLGTVVGTMTATDRMSMMLVSVQYMRPGPSIMRTAFRSFVLRAMMSPVR